MLKQEKIKYENRLIAFIDILGFKEIIKQSERGDDKIELVYSVLKHLKELEISDKWTLELLEIEEDAQKKGVKSFDVSNKINTTAFSDSIVISVKVDDNLNEMASTLIINLAYIGSILLEKGVLLRGGMTIGNIIHENNGIVFGQGLIEAYHLETRNALYPRIVLSDELIKRLNYPLETKKNRYPYHQYIQRFEDGCVGFHQMISYQVLQSWTKMTNESMREKLDKIRKKIISGLDSSFEYPNIFAKYKWLKKQYNNLIILDDYDFNMKTDENIKIKIRSIQDDIEAMQNIHYSYLDEIHEGRRDKDNERK